MTLMLIMLGAFMAVSTFVIVALHRLDANTMIDRLNDTEGDG